MSSDLDLDQRLVSLRKKARSHSKLIIDRIIENRLPKSCVFCAAGSELTKEHVVPKWTYEGSPGRRFTSTTNGMDQAYNAATVPACFECNSYLLGGLEKHLQRRLSETDLKSKYLNEDDENKLVLWLELIDYKFQVFDMRRRFLKPKDGSYIPFLANLPLAIMDDQAALTPSQVFSRLRQAFGRIARKSKDERRVALVTFRTRNPGFHFFHRTNDFIFIEMPKLGLAFFHFLVRKFQTPNETHEAAMEIIEKVY